MSLVGFNITNRPQQVKRRGASDTVDERITPAWLFEDLAAKHGPFTVDVASNEKNRKTEKFYDLQSDGLSQSWKDEVVWCNPPYSNIAAWVAKASHETLHNGCRKVVMLLPANRTEQRWWQEYIEPFRDSEDLGVKTHFLARRINFGVPGNEEAKFNSSPPFGLVVVVFN